MYAIYVNACFIKLNDLIMAGNVLDAIILCVLDVMINKLDKMLKLNKYL